MKDKLEKYLKEINTTIKSGQLLNYYKRIITKPEYKDFYKALNKYPSLAQAMTITRSDLVKIKEIGTFFECMPNNHKWTPFEKIFCGMIWKNDGLKKIRRIIEGAEAALKNKRIAPNKSNFVFYYFGRHLTNFIGEPIVDQHTLRAYALIQKPKMLKVQAYRDWFLKITKGMDYENSRKVDSILFAFGKLIKKYKKEFSPSFID